jgi:hypothetical protein
MAPPVTARQWYSDLCMQKLMGWLMRLQCNPRGKAEAFPRKLLRCFPETEA